MTFDSTRWTRLPSNEAAIWLCPDHPSWFVATAAGDRLLQELRSGTAACDTTSELSFLQRLPDPPTDRYPGRAVILPEIPDLTELWLHITERCNLACSHCLFSSGPESTSELPLTQLRTYLDEAAAQGCRTFALTGGEPLVHPDFIPLIDYILNIPESRIAILSNGLLLEKRLHAAWPRERIHLQISLDGKPDHHDSLRGKGSFEQLEQQLVWLRQHGWRFTLSCCVTRENADDLTWLVDYAADHGAVAVHLMWHFIRGRGNAEQHPAPLELLTPVLAAAQRAETRGIILDNIESLKGQIFSPPGTIHDGCSAGWSAAAIGPDNRLYPSAATIGITELATPLDNGLLSAWQRSPVLSGIRHTSVTALPDPWRYLLGGGDFDHSYLHCGTYSGHDPYQPLMAQLAMHLIVQAATRLPEPAGPTLRLKMGELLVSCGSHGLCHTNCLLALDDTSNSRSQVGVYYAAAAGDKRSEILNPVHYDKGLIDHIPAAYRFRGYGCGSPVMDAGLKSGERVVDLGCGSGVECYIAARLVGAQGCVTGIDMLEPMLELARQGAVEVRESLGYDNLRFLNGYLEQVPLPDNDADLVVSNCVLNLSSDKRSTFSEILRVLAPGGRLVAADVVCETEPDAAILNDETLRGECISGAMTQKDLLGILEESGFTNFRVLKRMPYRVVHGHPFFSLTFVASKAELPQPECIKVFYPGAAKGLLTTGGQWLRPGQTTMVTQTDADILGDQLWQLDEQGFVTNVAIAAGANCCIPPELQNQQPASLHTSQTAHADGCLVCGAALVYHTTEQESACHFCGKILHANACCQQGHFVCDRCHTGNALELIEHLCQASTELDPIRLFNEIRQHPSIPLHGPQYHALVPGVLLACLRNAGRPVTLEQLHSAIQRGSEVSGGSCGFMGICGAATGTGIAFSVLLEATPLKATARQTVQKVVQQVLSEIAEYEAARCCQRDCWIALRSGMRIAGELWGLELAPVEPYACSQMARNKECLGVPCPLWP